MSWVYAYDDGSFYLYKGESPTRALDHRTNSLEDAQIFDEPCPMQGGLWIPVAFQLNPRIPPLCYYHLVENLSGEVNGITCLVCGKTSYNSNDVENRYCAHCHEFHDDRELKSKE
jgi:hypothetical protein